MLTLAHPQYFLPVHGEFKQLKRHAETAEHLGYIPKQNIYIAENGQNIRLSRDGMAVEGTVPAGARDGGWLWRGRCGQCGPA